VTVEELHSLSALDLRELFARAESAPSELPTSAAGRREEVEPRLSAFATLALDLARSSAPSSSSTTAWSVTCVSS
jgi:hypothetical protein